MIAIYDQKRKRIATIENIFWDLSDSIKTTFSLSGQNITISIGDYENEQQIKYVLDQIANAIADGKHLYRMPSVEEVEKALSAKTCSKCRNYLQGKSDCLDCGLADLVNWQPKEQGGGMI